MGIVYTIRGVVSRPHQFFVIIVSIKLTITFDSPPQPVVCRNHILVYCFTRTFKLWKVTLEYRFVNHITSLTFQTAGVASKFLTELAEVVIATY